LELYRLKQQDATTKTLKAIKALQANRTAMQQQATALDRAAKLADAVDRPVQNYRTHMRDLNVALEHGTITKSKNTATVRHLRGELDGNIPVIGGLAKSYS
jgi:hypothetical protein